MQETGGQILKRTYGTVTYRARKIGIYSENNVPNAWLKQSELEMIGVMLQVLSVHL